MIKAIIFDYGGVLDGLTRLYGFGNYSKRCAKRFGAKEEEFLEIFIKNWDKAKVDEIPSQELWKKLGAFLNADSASARKEFLRGCILKPSVFGFAKKLKKHYKLGLLSNHVEDLMEEWIQEHKLGKVFDAMVLSYKSRKAKPEKAIYLETAKKLKVKPEECVFIDDLERNLLPARELGMKAIHFKNLAQLKKELKELGVKAN